ncbi:hypothetical protein, partial [Bacillus altitudinis]|uniref:hypothetical protein n=1 Tax=Bacillus altitudinis TaxID=293387 RepID=UPI001C92E08A
SNNTKSFFLFHFFLHKTPKGILILHQHLIPTPSNTSYTSFINRYTLIHFLHLSSHPPPSHF